MNSILTTLAPLILGTGCLEATATDNVTLTTQFDLAREVALVCADSPSQSAAMRDLLEESATSGIGTDPVAEGEENGGDVARGPWVMATEVDVAGDLAQYADWTKDLQLDAEVTDTELVALAGDFSAIERIRVTVIQAEDEITLWDHPLTGDEGTRIQTRNRAVPGRRVLDMLVRGPVTLELLVEGDLNPRFPSHLAHTMTLQIEARGDLSMF